MSKRNYSTLATALTFIGMAGGFALGIVINHWNHPTPARWATLLDPIGVIWTNALRMTIIPLIVSTLVTGISSVRDQKKMGRLGGLSILTFIGLLLFGAAYSNLATRAIMSQFKLSPEAVAAMKSSPSVDPGLYDAKSKPLGIAETVTGLFPSNPVKSAADGALLPLIVFTVIFALALARIDEERREIMLKFFHALSDISMIMVRWVMIFMPVGVFALVLPMAARMGFSIFGVLGYYTLLVGALLVGYMVLLYPIGTLLGKVSLGSFARAAAPAQAVAFSSRSSLASLPALIDGAQRFLPYPHGASSFVLSLAASTFKINRTVSSTATLLFYASVYGLTLDAATIAVFTLTVIAQSFSTPGIPGGAPMPMLPVYVALGVPVEGYILLHTTEPVTDLVKTVVNVTGNMTALTVASRFSLSNSRFDGK